MNYFAALFLSLSWGTNVYTMEKDDGMDIDTPHRQSAYAIMGDKIVKIDNGGVTSEVDISKITTYPLIGDIAVTDLSEGKIAFFNVYGDNRNDGFLKGVNLETGKELGLPATICELVLENLAIAHTSSGSYLCGTEGEFERKADDGLLLFKHTFYRINLQTYEQMTPIPIVEDSINISINMKVLMTSKGSFAYTLFYGSESNNMIVVDLSSGNRVKEFPLKTIATKTINSFRVYDHNKRTLATIVDEDNMACVPVVINLDTQEEVARLKGVKALEFLMLTSGDEEHYLVLTKGGVHIYDHSLKTIKHTINLNSFPLREGPGHEDVLLSEDKDIAYINGEYYEFGDRRQIAVIDLKKNVYSRRIDVNSQYEIKKLALEVPNAGAQTFSSLTNRLLAMEDKAQPEQLPDLFLTYLDQLRNLMDKMGQNPTLETQNFFAVLDNMMNAVPTSVLVFDKIIDLLGAVPLQAEWYGKAQMKAGKIIFLRHPKYNPMNNQPLDDKIKVQKYMWASYYYGRSLTKKGRDQVEYLSKKMNEMKM